LRELSKGSLEEAISAAEVAVASAAEKFGAESGDVYLISTFPHHAVVATSEGRVFRVKLGSLDGGGRAVVEHEEVDVPTIGTKKERDEFFRAAEADVLRSLAEGDKLTAASLLREFIQAAPLMSPYDPLDGMRVFLEGAFDADRPWRQTYAAHQSAIHRFLWGASGTAHRDAPKPKYQGLYFGESVRDPSGYHSAVSSDIGLLAERLREMWERFQQSFGEYASGDNGWQDGRIAVVNESFRVFAEDYGDELATLCRLMENAAKDDSEDTVRARAMLYDHVSRQLPTLEIAGRLLGRTAADLQGTKAGAVRS